MQQNQTVIERVIEPAEIARAEFFYYSIKRNLKVRKLILHLTDGTEVRVFGKQIRQFFKYTDLDYSELIRMRDWRARNALINDAVKDMSTIKVSSVFEPKYGYFRAIRIVTPKFQAIPHSFALKVTEEALAGLGLEYEMNVKYDYGMWAEFVFPSISEPELGIIYRISMFNRNDGSHSLRFYGGALVLACTNGLIASKLAYKVTIPHVHDEESVVSRIKEGLFKIISDADNVFREIRDSMAITLSVEDAIKFIRSLAHRFPQHIINALLDAYMRKYGSLVPSAWRLSQALSDVGSNYSKATQNYKEQLQRLAVKVLEGVS